jgi:hypothetical protein
MKNETRVATLDIAPLGIGYLCLKEYSRFVLMFFGGVPSIPSALVMMTILSVGMCVWDGRSDAEQALVLAPIALPLTLSLFTMMDAQKRGKRSTRRR